MGLDFTDLNSNRRFKKFAIATSQPDAVKAGLWAFEEGGNAVDATLAAAMALTVVEPTMNGLGGDCFAIVSKENLIRGLNSSGRSPDAWSPDFFSKIGGIPERGVHSITVPGLVRGWAALHQQYGQLPFSKLTVPAARLAREGFILTPQTARLWKEAPSSVREGPGFRTFFERNGTPKVKERVKLPELADTIEEIGATQGESFYTGTLARRTMNYLRNLGSLMTSKDLERHSADWVEPIQRKFYGFDVHELPPNSQGLGVLIALGILEKRNVSKMRLRSPEWYHELIEAVKLSTADLHEITGDPDQCRLAYSNFLDDKYIQQRSKLIDQKKAKTAKPGNPIEGGTVYVSAADASGLTVSFIQSNFYGFGSGVVDPVTGVSFHNRGIGFNLRPGHINCLAGGKRPFHTLIPAMVSMEGVPVMSFGLMGGSMQAQGHVQLLCQILTHNESPQTACDTHRFRFRSGMQIDLEMGMNSEIVNSLTTLGHKLAIQPSDQFGGAQILTKTADGFIGASDHRKDGYADGI